MRWLTLRPWLGTVVRLALGAIWIWASLSKIKAPREFVQTVRAYDATPEWMSKAIGYGLPVLELCIGVLLILGVATRAAAAFSGVLFLVFLVGLVQAAARGIKLNCGCFGGGGSTTGSTTYTLDILRDLGLLAMAAYLVLWSLTRLSIDEFVSRHDYVEPPSAKRMRSEQGRRKYNALLEEKKRAARIRALWLNSAFAVVIVLIALIGIGVQAGRAKIQGALSAPHASPTNGVVYGKAAAATVDVYEDFQCPHCLEFEKSVSATMDADVVANKAQVRFHPLAFLDAASSGNAYSTRAANAALCASDVSVDAFVKYHNVLFGTYKGQQVQPAEGSNGRSDLDLEAYAEQAGIPTGAPLTTFVSCVQSQKHKALVQAITDQASQSGVNGTPTILVNGQSISPTLAAFNAAVDAALKKGPAPNPSPTTASSSVPASGSSTPASGSSLPAPASSSKRP